MKIFKQEKPFTLLARCLFLLPALFTTFTVQAEETPPENTPMLLAYGGRVVPPMETVQPHQASANAAEEPPRVWDRALPFFAQRVIDKGYDLPNPYDVGVSLYVGAQDLVLGDLAVGLNGKQAKDASFVTFPHSRIDTTTEQIQLGAWVFPFMNVYGIVGHVKGKGDIDINIDGRSLMEFLNVPGCNAPPALRPAICSQTLKGTAHADYDGNNYGLGMTVAGAWHDLFFALPVTYIISDLSVSDSKAKSWNIAPRVGWNFHPPKTGMLTFYGGGTWLKADTYITGHFVFDTASTPIGQDTTLEYSIKEHPKMRWNALAGGNWLIDKHWNIAAEIGFAGTRDDVIITGFYRF